MDFVSISLFTPASFPSLHIQISCLCFSDVQLRKATSHLPQCQQPRQTAVNPESKFAQGESAWPSLGQISTLTKFAMVGIGRMLGVRGQGHAQLHENENHYQKKKENYGGDRHPPNCHSTAYSESQKCFRIQSFLYSRIWSCTSPTASPAESKAASCNQIHQYFYNESMSIHTK